MMRAHSWLSLGFVLVSLGGLTASCGSDEATQDGDDPQAGDTSTAGQTVGGTGGRGGAGGRGGSGGVPTAGGTGGTNPGGTDLGKACSEAAPNCGDLQCLVALDIPGGLCTAECTEDAECQALGPNASCLSGICFEGCSLSGLGTPCHGRPDMACQPYEIVEGGPCEAEAQCAIGELCLGGACLRPLVACLPSCDSDADCEGGFCDLRTGACSDEDRQGLPIGSECDPDLPADEEDPCEGFCVGSGDGIGFCSGICRWSSAPACGYAADAEVADAACIWPSALQPDANEGETGFCGQLCDCDAECRHPDLKCVEFTQGGMPAEFYSRRGLCAQVEPGDETITECEGGTGEGGAGAGGQAGAGEGGAPSAGAGGDGGTSSGGTGGAPNEAGSGGAE